MFNAWLLKTPQKSGIPNGSRARAVLFASSTLVKSSTAYPSIGQKKLNGAASRMLIYFGVCIAAEISHAHPTDVNRPGPASGKKMLNKIAN